MESASCRTPRRFWRAARGAEGFERTPEPHFDHVEPRFSGPCRPQGCNRGRRTKCPDATLRRGGRPLSLFRPPPARRGGPPPAAIAAPPSPRGAPPPPPPPPRP